MADGDVTPLGKSPTAVYRGPFGEEQATRLLWRAGFGPRPGDPERLAKLGLEAAVASLTRPAGPARLIGKAAHDDKGNPLDPINVWGDDHCWWLDRMVRSDHQLIERMTLIWHSWFATSESASSAKLMIDQNWMMRRNALGNFHRLLLNVTVDPAMLLWLNGNTNAKGYPNENYGREMLELFTLGQGRGYSEEDVVQNSRAVTGWTNNWSQTKGPVDFHFDPQLHDYGIKKIFGHVGRWNWRDSARLAVTHESHPSFFVNKLWGYFVGAELPARTGRELERAYVSSGFEIGPIVEAILMHPLFYEGPRLVTPPVVWTAGLLRASRQAITTTSWAWVASLTGQVLFQPPNVSGWDYAQWLDTSRWAGRLEAVNTAINKPLQGKTYPYGIRENNTEAYEHALDFWGGIPLSDLARDHLLDLGRRISHGQTQKWEQVEFRQLRQNALRNLIPMTPDWMTA